MLKPIFRKLFPNMGGMSTEADSSHNEPQYTSPEARRFGRSNRKKSNGGLTTLQAPVHREHAVSRPSVAYKRDIERQDPDHDLWDDADIADDGTRLQGETPIGKQSGKGSPATST